MQEMLETLTLVAFRVGSTLLGRVDGLDMHARPVVLKGMDDVADGLHATAHQLRNRLRRQPAGTRQHNLGTTHAEGIGGAPIRFSLPVFIIGQGSDIER